MKRRVRTLSTRVMTRFCAEATLAVMAMLPVVSTATDAMAEDAAEQPSDSPNKLSPDAKAKELYLRGDRLYAEGEYEEAVDAFEQAYELSKRPALLYNLANAYERLGRYESAARVLRQFLPHAPEGQKDLVKKRIESLEGRIEEQEKKSQAQQPQPSQQPPANQPSSPKTTSNEAHVSASPKSNPPVLGYALLGLGVVGLGTGGYFALAANSARSQADDHCQEFNGSHLCDSGAKTYLDKDSLNSTVADISFGVGALATVAGLVVVLSSGSDSNQEHEQTSSLKVLPSTSPHGGQLNIVGQF